MTRVYMDGVFDLFHRGHIEAIKKCKNFGDEIVIGIISDKDAESYKRLPLINENDRIEIIKNLKIVNEVIPNAPLILTKEFINNNKLDIIVHSFANEKDFEKQKEFFKIPIEMGIFKKINYYSNVSTTDIIEKIINRGHSI